MGDKADGKKRNYSKLHFTHDDEEKIITFVKQYPELYDPKNSNFKNKAHKDILWSDLGKTLDNIRTGWPFVPKKIVSFIFLKNYLALLFFKGLECNRKWINMRDAYKKGKSKKLGSGSAANSSKNLARDESMAFLGEIETTNTRFAFDGFEIFQVQYQTCICDFSTTSNIDLPDNPADNVPIVDIDDDNDSLEIDLNKPLAKKRKSSTNEEWSQLDNFRKEIQKHQEKKIELIEKIVGKKTEKCDLELFFSSIFKTVRKFKAKDQALLKIKIHQLVSEREIAYLDSTQNSNDVMLSTTDVNNTFDCESLINFDI